MVTDLDGFLRDPLSRRRLLGITGAGLAGGSASFLAACGDDTKNPNVQTGPDESDEADVEVLNSALDLEFMAVEAYKTGAGRLRGSLLQIAQGFLEQEQEHVDGLTAAIRDLGGRPNEPKSEYEFPRMRSQREVLRYAIDLENTAIAAYIDLLPKLSQGDLRATTAAILTVEAEHISVLLGALGEPQAPDVLVNGRAS